MKQYLYNDGVWSIRRFFPAWWATTYQKIGSVIVSDRPLFWKKISQHLYIIRQVLPEALELTTESLGAWLRAL